MKHLVPGAGYGILRTQYVMLSKFLFFCFLVFLFFYFLPLANTGQRAPRGLARPGKAGDHVPRGLDGEPAAVSQKREIRNAGRSPGSNAHGNATKKTTTKKNNTQANRQSNKLFLFFQFSCCLQRDPDGLESSRYPWDSVMVNGSTWLQRHYCCIAN